MSTENEINSKINEFESFNENLNKIIALKIKLHKDFINALRVSKEDLVSGSKLMESNLRNENRIDVIIRKGIRNAEKEIKTHKSLVLRHTRNNTFKKSISTLEQVFSAYKQNMHNLERRLKAQQNFIDKGDKNSFDRLIESWKIERKSNLKLIGLVVNLDKSQVYMNKIVGAVRTGLRVGFTATALNVGYSIIHQEINFDNIADKAGTAAFILAASTITVMALKIIKMYQNIDLLYIQEFERIKS